MKKIFRIFSICLLLSIPLFLLAIGIRSAVKGGLGEVRAKNAHTDRVAESYKNTHTAPKKFCVKVVPYTDDSYTIHFSGDGEDFQEIKEVLDTKYLTGPRGFLVLNPFITDNKNEAINLARKLKSYQSCIDYNKQQERIFARKSERYKRNPPVAQGIWAELDKPKPKLTETVIYCE